MLHQFRGRVDQMLAVIEHEQHCRVGDGANESFGGPAAAVGNLECRRDFAWDACGIGDRGEIDPADPSEPASVCRRDFARESSFAAATGAGECEQPRRSDQTAELGQLMGATDEPGQVNR